MLEQQQLTEDRRVSMWGTAFIMLGAVTVLAALVIYFDLFQLQTHVQNLLRLERLFAVAQTIPGDIQAAYLSQLVESAAVVATVVGVLVFLLGVMMRRTTKR